MAAAKQKAASPDPVEDEWQAVCLDPDCGVKVGSPAEAAEHSDNTKHTLQMAG